MTRGQFVRAWVPVNDPARKVQPQLGHAAVEGGPIGRLRYATAVPADIAVPRSATSGRGVLRIHDALRAGVRARERLA